MIRIGTQPRTRQQGRISRSSMAPVCAVRMMAGIGALLALTLVIAPGRALAQPGGALKDVAFDQKLNTQIPLSLHFRDETGKFVTLAEYFGKRPVILVLGYKNCPMLCSQVLGELTRSLKPLNQSIGKDFDIINVSINPKESAEQADSQRRNYLKRYNRGGADQGWHSLVGDKVAIDSLCAAVGFRYKYSETTGLYAHASGFVLLTPTGKVSRYFYGVEYPARELQPAIALAALSKIDSPIQKVLLYCYDYDPATGRFTYSIMNVIRVLGVATALALGAFLVAMVRRDRRMGRATDSPFTELPPGSAVS